MGEKRRVHLPPAGLDPESSRELLVEDAGADGEDVVEPDLARVVPRHMVSHVGPGEVDARLRAPVVVRRELQAAGHAGPAPAGHDVEARPPDMPPHRPEAKTASFPPQHAEVAGDLRYRAEVLPRSAGMERVGRGGRVERENGQVEGAAQVHGATVVAVHPPPVGETDQVLGHHPGKAQVVPGGRHAALGPARSHHHRVCGQPFHDVGPRMGNQDLGVGQQGQRAGIPVRGGNPLHPGSKGASQGHSPRPDLHAVEVRPGRGSDPGKERNQGRQDRRLSPRPPHRTITIPSSAWSRPGSSTIRRTYTPPGRIRPPSSRPSIRLRSKGSVASSSSRVNAWSR